MTMDPDWLPNLMLFEDFDGNWQRYEDEVYSRFYQDFIESHPHFNGKPVYVKRSLEKGKERGFWHLITEGPAEQLRTPSLERCERIAWVRAIIEHANDPVIKQWKNQRKGKTRHLLWLENAEFLVILENRSSAWVLWTAYPVTYEHRKERLRKEHKDYLKKPTPP